MRSPSPPASPPRRQSREMRQSMLKNLPTDPNLITPAIRAALPAFQMVQDRERTPELDSEESSLAELAEPEPEFILAPRTYSPAPAASPKPPSAPVQEAPPAIRERSSLRNRFSLKRKDTPSEVTTKPQAPIEREDSYWGPQQRVNSVSVPPPREREPINTPPSRGLDSAYCSDFEKASPPATFSPHPQPRSHIDPQIRSSSYNSNPSRPQVETRSSSYTNPRAICQNHDLQHPPIFTRDFVPSPRSDQQFFRPVNASPNSPLQRPWTAGPTNPLHQHSNSSTSSLQYRGHTHTPSALGNRRNAPSAMGMSVMTDVTVIDANGEKKKVKKKRSAFGWLKKAFSLSEEERAAFEERRRLAEVEAKQYYEGAEERRWVDGKRVDGRPKGRPMTQMR